MIHLTLNTRHSRESERSEITDDTLAVAHELIARALTGERPPIPAVPELCTLTAAAHNSGLLVTVWAEGGRRAPIATIGVVTQEADSARLWQLLHEHAAGIDLATVGQSSPVAPWCAVRLEIGVALYPSLSAWLGDFERCLAWAWIENHG